MQILISITQILTLKFCNAFFVQTQSIVSSKNNVVRNVRFYIPRIGLEELRKQVTAI